MKPLTRFLIMIHEVVSRRTSLVMLLLGLCVLASYANSLANGFVRDDYYVVEINRESLGARSVVNAFTSADQLVETNPLPFYRPLSKLSYLVDKRLFGLDPAGYHAVNVLLHILTTVLVYVMVLRLGGNGITSLGTALLFGLHPVNTETVNFISARNNILAAIFTLGSVLAFLNAENRGKKTGYAVSALLFFLGLLSKESAVMLIPLLIFLRVYGKGDRHRETGAPADFLFIVFHLVFFGFYIVLRSAAVDIGTFPAIFAGLTDRLRLFFYIVPTYLSLTLAPNTVTYLYEIPVRFDGILWVLVAKWVIILSAIFWVILKRNQLAMFGLVWLILNLIPVSNLVPLPSNSMAERYLYIPLIGVFMIIADGVDRFFSWKGAKELSLALILSLSAVLAVITVNRNHDWKDEFLLSLSAVKAAPASPIAHFDLACSTYMMKGDRARAKAEFETALSLDPHFYWASWANYYLGAISLQDHDPDEAARYFEKSNALFPSFPAAHYALGSLLFNRGDKAALGEFEQMLGKLNIFSLHHVIELDNRIGELDPKRRSRETAAPAVSRFRADEEKANWLFFYRFRSGTELYRNAEIQQRGGESTVVMMQRLSKRDKRSYAARCLRFPLEQAAESRIVFRLNCHEMLYKPLKIEFRDPSGFVLGQIETEKEAFIAYEYALPGTAMSALFASVCASAP